MAGSTKEKPAKTTRSAAKSPRTKSPAKKKAAAKEVAKPRGSVKTKISKDAVVVPVAEERAIPEITRRMIAAAAAACEDKKAEDTRILELDAVDAGFTDFFLITSGTNDRQTQSIADEIEARLKRDFATYPNSVEGKRQGEWILLDYVDFVVHVFLAEKRAFYDIERLRKSARAVDVAQLQKALVKKTTTSRKRVASNRTSVS